MSNGVAYKRASQSILVWFLSLAMAARIFLFIEKSNKSNNTSNILFNMCFGLEILHYLYEFFRYST